LVLAGVAAAQTNNPTSARVRISGAYLFVSDAGLASRDNSSNALTSEIGVRLSPRFSAKVAVFNHPDGQVYAAGPEYRFLASKLLPSTDAFKADKFELFVHALIGASRSAEQTKFAYAVGGGVDFQVEPNVAIRIAQVEYLRAPFLNNGGQVFAQNSLKVSTGLSLTF
ncbi:MAG: hypothetical protein ACRD3I_10100, partial [Terriglobales bacterium]